MNDREELRAAAQIVQVLGEEVAATEDALRRAQTMVIEAEAELESFKDLDRSIAEWRKHALKQGADPRELPAELAEQKTAKLTAGDELELARATAADLANDLESLQLKYKRAKEEQATAAMRVLNAHGDQLANELIELNARSDRLRCLLTALPGVAVSNERGIIRWINTERATWALNGYKNGRAFPASVDPVKLTADRWQRRFAALLSDPEAIIDDVQAVDPEELIYRDGSVFVTEG